LSKYQASLIEEYRHYLTTNQPSKVLQDSVLKLMHKLPIGSKQALPRELNMQKTLPLSPSDFLAFRAKAVDIVRDQMQLGNTAYVPCQLHFIHAGYVNCGGSGYSPVCMSAEMLLDVNFF
jgi:hypothetical protein